MAYKKFNLDDELEITIYKHRASRSMRLSVAADGSPRLSIPRWIPYKAGLEFAKSRRQWLDSQLPAKVTLSDGASIGKAHRLYLIPSDCASISTRLDGSQILVKYPRQAELSNASLQSKIEQACIRALRAEANQLLPTRLSDLAKLHDFKYKSLRIKLLKSRWGSCDQHGNITLNLFLMQLPWESIDYVILHELVHTKVFRHGPDFWQALSEVLADVKALREALRSKRPALMTEDVS
jgi:predicted metal-dependent hydrolase